ncbi:MAG: hypothetical protein HY053_09435 [Proteobacteria bacterium]|nr:hypothetical protein [Pseudomonadota bacterium]
MNTSPVHVIAPVDADSPVRPAYRKWFGLGAFVSVMTIIAGAIDETVRRRYGVSTGFSNHLMMAGGGGFIGLGLIHNTSLAQHPPVVTAATPDGPA